VSPAVAKTSDAEVIACARELIERHGSEALSMRDIARAIGVRAPSLYKRFANRTALLLAVDIQVMDEAAQVLTGAARGASPTARLRAIAHAYRRYARAHPRLYQLVYSGRTPRDPAATAARQRAVMPAVLEFGALVGEARALAATRVLWAFLHGFVSMENVGEFRLGPGIDDAFRLGLEVVINSWSR
jgi:AcrR family transcriptional regulator